MPEISFEESQEYAALKDQRDRYDESRYILKFAVWGALLVVLIFLGGCFGYKGINPQMNLYRSNTEKQAVIKEQEAISEAEVFAAEKRVIAAKAEAEARRIEAAGIADAQQIISETLTDEYLVWRFYETLATTDNDIVYVPTENGIPVTEAGRAVDSDITVQIGGDE